MYMYTYIYNMYIRDFWLVVQLLRHHQRPGRVAYASLLQCAAVCCSVL